MTINAKYYMILIYINGNKKSYHRNNKALITANRLNCLLSGAVDKHKYSNPSCCEPNVTDDCRYTKQDYNISSRLIRII